MTNETVYSVVRMARDGRYYWQHRSGANGGITVKTSGKRYATHTEAMIAGRGAL